MTHDPSVTSHRLLDESAAELERATDFESSLLRAAMGETPSPELSAKMMAPLAAGAAAGSAAAAGKLIKGATAKWLGAGASLLLAGGVYYAVTATEGPPSRVNVPPTAPIVNSPPPSEPHEAHVPELAPPSDSVRPTESKLSEEQRTQTTRPDSLSAGPVKNTSSTLAEEMQLLDRARSALKSRKDPEEALRLLSLYEKKYPQGTLRQEATVLRVSALKESGASARADELKSEFLKANPKSAHKKQLEDSSSDAR